MDPYDPTDQNFLSNPLSLPPGVPTDEYGNIIQTLGMPEQITGYGPGVYGR